MCCAVLCLIRQYNSSKSAPCEIYNSFPALHILFYIPQVHQIVDFPNLQILKKMSNRNAAYFNSCRTENFRYRTW